MFSALHSFADAEKRWNMRRKACLTDEGLREEIGFEFGIQGGIGGDGYMVNYKGGKNPEFSFSNDGQEETKLKGKALLDAVRGLLNIPRPADKNQLTLF